MLECVIIGQRYVTDVIFTNFNVKFHTIFNYKSQHKVQIMKLGTVREVDVEQRIESDNLKKKLFYNKCVFFLIQHFFKHRQFPCKNPGVTF